MVYILVYIPLGQDWISQFSIGLTSGAITIDGSFDREAQSRYIVGIQVGSGCYG